MMLLRLAEFCALLKKICSILTVLLPMIKMTVIINNWKASLVFIHSIELILSFKD